MVTVEDLLTRDDVLAVLKVSRASLYKFISKDGFPRPLKIGAVNRWRSDEVKAWLEAQPRANIHVEQDDDS